MSRVSCSPRIVSISAIALMVWICAEAFPQERGGPAPGALSPDALRAMLRDADPGKRAGAAVEIGRRGLRESVPDLVSMLDRDLDENARTQAIWALGRLGDRTATSMLTRKLISISRPNQWEAIRSLARLDATEVSHWLRIRVLQGEDGTTQPDDRTRAEACMALCELGDPLVIQYFKGSPVPEQFRWVHMNRFGAPATYDRLRSAEVSAESATLEVLLRRASEQAGPMLVGMDLVPDAVRSQRITLDERATSCRAIDVLERIEGETAFTMILTKQGVRIEKKEWAAEIWRNYISSTPKRAVLPLWEWTGGDSRRTNRGALKVTSAYLWREVWNSHSEFPVPEVDFDRNMVIAFFGWENEENSQAAHYVQVNLGARPAGFYRIQVIPRCGARFLLYDRGNNIIQFPADGDDLDVHFDLEVIRQAKCADEGIGTPAKPAIHRFTTVEAYADFLKRFADPAPARLDVDFEKEMILVVEAPLLSVRTGIGNQGILLYADIGIRGPPGHHPPELTSNYWIGVVRRSILPVVLVRWGNRGGCCPWAWAAVSLPALERNIADERRAELEAETSRREAKRKRDETIVAAKEALAAGDFDLAERYFNEAIASFPRDAEAKIGLARVRAARVEARYGTAMQDGAAAESRKDWKTADEAYKRALEEKSGDLAAHAAAQRVAALWGFITPTADRDSHGNPIVTRNGSRTDLEGKPYEMWLDVPRAPSPMARIEFVLIPSGEFMMGSPDSESERFDTEGPVHCVRISRPFYVAKYEVTQGQWEAVMGNNPSLFKNAGKDAPVEQVSWEDCKDFCKKTGLSLPTEAQWEYACRAGTKTRFNRGNTDADLRVVGWFVGNSGNATHPVGILLANAWGLYDMHGNVWEWCDDAQSRNYRGAPTDGSAWLGGSSSGPVERGGGWPNIAAFCRSAFRGRGGTDHRCSSTGFRPTKLSR
jgi:formylglycine-generating enzyme required for sulfatase activity